MEFLRNVWGNVTHVVTDWYYYWFGIPGSQQLLLEYVIMDENLSTKYVYTGDDAPIKSKSKSKPKTNDLLDKLVTDQNKSVPLSNGQRYTFLFEQVEGEQKDDTIW